MPASPRSLSITNSYRARLIGIRERLERLAKQRWPSIEALDSTDWPDRMAAAVTQAQTEAVRATSGYLTAYLSSELGKRTSGPTLESRSYAGKSRDGRALADALRSPLIGVRAALAVGKTAPEALQYGLDRGVRMVGVDFDHSYRSALLDAIDDDERFDGWRRVTTGTCGACAAKAGSLSHGLMFQVHPNCNCVSQPVVKGLAETVAVPTGTEIFASKSEEEQDEMLGPEAAAKVRAGEIELSELVEESHLETGENFITQRPVAALGA